MKKIIIALFLFVGTTYGALPPEYQNLKDLDVMVSFISAKPNVLATLKSIDFENFTVYFAYDCKATFKRKVIERPYGWVGLAAPLEFDQSNCEL